MVVSAITVTTAPRPRGGQSIVDSSGPRACGRSPPTRGSVEDHVRLLLLQGPLPAHAGVSRLGEIFVQVLVTAPRPRGGQSVEHLVALSVLGRSPPTRGSVGLASADSEPRLPLPAHAGVSRRSVEMRRCGQTAPRPRGGQSVRRAAAAAGKLRSPPTRGSVAATSVRGRRPRPLPAHAGVSRSGLDGRAAPEAAPRPRGGQSIPRACQGRRDSRSPPTRGSVDDVSGGVLGDEPLPAHAGVSRPRRPSTMPGITAPRPRGGQSAWTMLKLDELLRSPPTRGSVA